MKKFKSFFYGIYLMYFAFSAFIAFNYEDIVLRWDWDWISTWTGLIKFVLQMGAVGSILFITEIIVENIHLVTKRSKIKSLEIEILDLKAKLYDRSNTETPAPPVASTPAPAADTEPEEEKPEAATEE
ncbi:hypothetical protein N7E81_05995 [Reichenbachiella carrageenanivorans]|uniref:Lipopolysaccharide assembly protein A domain-containing protein n=1 Tax=Reichenbachiella carrageenanivorans TaxID=2979869 RepID=A0ABY6D406_9BACT|nr:hypothetical protein [Reichenbachiella carrageenanivorans]UXX80649.1 hypothetical protein N7E81_05995 [Reichenbachiella carrageenanivorans]